MVDVYGKSPALTCINILYIYFFIGPSTSKSVFCEPLNVHDNTLAVQTDLCTHISPPLFSPTASTQTPLQLSSNTPRKLVLKSKIRSLKKNDKQRRLFVEKSQTTESQKLSDFKKLCDLFLDAPLSGVIKSHVSLKGKKVISRRYSLEVKQFALTLNFLSPKAYSYLSKMLTLPTKRCLQRLTSQLPCKPGLDNQIIDKALEIKTKTMLDQDKHCILCIDEMSLKSNLFYETGCDKIVGFQDIGSTKKDSSICKNALVIMARGLYSPWKQPFAYFFVGSQLKALDLKVILEKCVIKLINIGLFVEGISSDMGSNFIQLANLFGVTPENPEFELGNHKLLYIFDPCHLIKATRNNLLNHSFHFGDKKTSWTYIESFYNQDKQQFYRCAPKLTDAHLHPSTFQRMKVSLASQILSHTVASGMNVYLTMGGLPSEAIGTIEVIEKFNNLFDILNSFALRNANHYKTVFDGSQFQMKFFEEMLNFLKELKVVNQKNLDISNKVKFSKCWMITIKSVLSLWEKLSKLDFKYLKTRRLNTDCLENFFGSVRQQGGNNISPTPIQFQRAFKKLFCQNYLHSNTMNCRNDLDKILMDIKAINFNELFENKVKPESALVLPDYGYRNQNIPTQNAFRYVCGYVLKKALNTHSNCDICMNFAKHCETLDIENLLIYYKAFDSSKHIYGGLQSPSDDFVRFIFELEKTFNSSFEEICSGQGISHQLLNLMKNIEFHPPCIDFPKPYILKLFIRMKIFYTLKYTNRDLSTLQKDKKNIRKLKILSNI